jgi:hypothetical protein
MAYLSEKTNTPRKHVFSRGVELARGLGVDGRPTPVLGTGEAAGVRHVRRTRVLRGAGLFRGDRGFELVRRVVREDPVRVGLLRTVRRRLGLVRAHATREHHRDENERASHISSKWFRAMLPFYQKMSFLSILHGQKKTLRARAQQGLACGASQE